MSYSSEVLADSPVAWWRLGDRGAGTSCADSSGNSGTITYRSGTVSAAGLLPADGDAATDSGSGVAVGPGSTALAAVTGDLTLEAWVRLDGTGAANIIEHANPSTSHFYLIADRPAGRWTFGWNDGIWRDHFFGASFTTGATVHVCAVADATTAKIYINGSLLGSQARSGGAVAWGLETVALGINPRTSTNVLDGVLDEVAVYDTALSASRIAAHYTAGTTSPSTTGALAATLPALSANLSGSLKFAGTIAATLPALGASLSGTSTIAGIAGTITATLPPLGGSLAGAYSDAATLAAILPPLSASLTATYVAPPVTGTLAASLPSLAASLAGTAYEPGMTGTLNAVLPALSALLSGDVLGRNGFGLALDSTATLTVLEQVDTTTLPTPTGTPGVPATVLHIIAPTVPAPTLVNGRPQ